MRASIKPKPTTIEIPYQPLPKQGEFHGNGAKYRFFGGGFGNGKTSAGCAEAFALALEYPGCHGLICRQTRPELEATTMETFWQGGGGNPASDWPGVPDAAVRSHNKSKHRIELINGSIIHYWPLDDPKKLTNLNLGWFLIDQAEEVTEEMFLMLCGRLRQLNSPRKGLCLFNPNGHDWIWKRLIQLELPDHSLVHAKTSDNPNLPPDYIDQFKNYPDSWKKRFFEGSFDVFTGQIWPEYDPDVHELTPLPLEDWWEFAEGIDHGRRNPTAVLWAAFFSRFGHNYCFVVEEHYEAGKIVSHHAKRILQVRRQLGISPQWTVIDASASQKDPNTERSVIDEYWDQGVGVIPSDRHKIARIARVAEWLALKPDVPHPITGELRQDGWPNLYIYKNCANLKEHVPAYKWKPKPPTQEADALEEPLKKDDHDVDALGYILMMRPAPGEKPVEYDPFEDPRSTKYWNHYNRRSGRIRSGKTKAGVD
jgi:hypothetical protein